MGLFFSTPDPDPEPIDPRRFVLSEAKESRGRGEESSEGSYGEEEGITTGTETESAESETEIKRRRRKPLQRRHIKEVVKAGGGGKEEDETALRQIKRLQHVQSSWLPLQTPEEFGLEEDDESKILVKGNPVSTYSRYVEQTEYTETAIQNLLDLVGTYIADIKADEKVGIPGAAELLRAAKIDQERILTDPRIKNYIAVEFTDDIRVVWVDIERRLKHLKDIREKWFASAGKVKHEGEERELEEYKQRNVGADRVLKQLLDQKEAEVPLMFVGLATKSKSESKKKMIERLVKLWTEFHRSLPRQVHEYEVRARVNDYLRKALRAVGSKLGDVPVTPKMVKQWMEHQKSVNGGGEAKAGSVFKKFEEMYKDLLASIPADQQVIMADDDFVVADDEGLIGVDQTPDFLDEADKVIGMMKRKKRASKNVAKEPKAPLVPLALPKEEEPLALPVTTPLAALPMIRSDLGVTTPRFKKLSTSKVKKISFD